MTLLWQRMAQIPDSMFLYIDTLRGGGFRPADGRTLNDAIVEPASRLEPGESVQVTLANIHFYDPDARATLTITMNDRHGIHWNLELPE